MNNFGTNFKKFDIALKYFEKRTEKMAYPSDSLSENLPAMEIRNSLAPQRSDETYEKAWINFQRFLVVGSVDKSPTSDEATYEVNGAAIPSEEPKEED